MNIFWIILVFLSSCGLEKENISDNKVKQTTEIKQEIKQDIKIKQEKIIEDSLKDSSILKFVSSNIWFTKSNYVPENLVYIKWDYVIDNKWSSVLRLEAKNALDNIAKDFYIKFNKKLIIVSAYRSYTTQKAIKDSGCSDRFCAKAWFSEHQSWLAVDFFEATTKDKFLSNKNYKLYFEWLNENAFKYWFHNTYQKWIEIDTYEIEPWHRRYLWVELATELKQNNLTYAEYKKNKLSK